MATYDYRPSYTSGGSWTTNTTTMFTYPTTVISNGPVTVAPPPVAKPKGPLDWLTDEVEATCAKARAA